MLLENLGKANTLSEKRSKKIKLINHLKKSGMGAVFDCMCAEASEHISFKTTNMAVKALIDGIKEDVDKIECELKILGVEVESEQ